MNRFLLWIWQRAISMGATLRDVLHEVFDESAYLRFLERRCLSASASSYNAFCQERDQLRARRPRCC